MRVSNTLAEVDKYGQTYSVSLRNNKGKIVKRWNRPPPASYQTMFKHYYDLEKFKAFGQSVFLPANYPDSVTPDYYRYQVLNAAQAFCSSLASLISSRATLQGFGIGSASASANDALLLTILLDVYGRLTTIVSAHIFGSSLGPEAKKYRFVADILNDIAVILDTLSPVAKAYGHPKLRIAALCISASCRALCGIAAGGSKAAISLHFASPVGGKGDLGDLNAKDSSKETVLALFGMLLGSFIVPQLQTAWSTYTTLFVLLSLHIAINYAAVTGLVLHSLNAQRMWYSYALHLSSEEPTPERVNALEDVFGGDPSVFRDPHTRRTIGRVSFGSSLAAILQAPLQPRLLTQLTSEGYVIWFDPRSLSYPSPDSVAPVVVSGVAPRLHVAFRQGHRLQRRRAWLHAGWICLEINRHRSEKKDEPLDATDLVLRGYKNDYAWKFDQAMEKLHWNIRSFVLDCRVQDVRITTVGCSAEESKMS